VNKQQVNEFLNNQGLALIDVSDDCDQKALGHFHEFFVDRSNIQIIVGDGVIVCHKWDVEKVRELWDNWVYYEMEDGTPLGCEAYVHF